MKFRGKWSHSLTIFFLPLLLALIPAAVYGHTLYIQSSRYKVDGGKQSPLFFCYGHRVPVDDGLRSEKLKSLRIHTPGGEIREITVRNETGLHSYMVEYDVPGTFVLTAETNPGYYTVYVDDKGREHHTIKPKNAVADKAKEIKQVSTANSIRKPMWSATRLPRCFPLRSACPWNWRPPVTSAR